MDASGRDGVPVPSPDADLSSEVARAGKTIEGIFMGGLELASARALVSSPASEYVERAIAQLHVLVNEIRAAIFRPEGAASHLIVTV